MEAMTIHVREVAIGAEIVTAVVTATSRARFRGRPLATIRVRLRLSAVDGESPRDRRERVREEALRSLDVA